MFLKRLLKPKLNKKGQLEEVIKWIIYIGLGVVVGFVIYKIVSVAG